MNTNIDVKFRVRKNQIRDLVQVAVPSSMNEMSDYYLVTYELEGPSAVIDLMTSLSLSKAMLIAA